MSLLSSFFAKHLVPALESAFIAHAPDMQKMLVTEASLLARSIIDWVESKTMLDDKDD